MLGAPLDCVVAHQRKGKVQLALEGPRPPRNDGKGKRKAHTHTHTQHARGNNRILKSADQAVVVTTFVVMRTRSLAYFSGK